MDDAQRAEMRGLGGKSSKSDGPKHRRNTIILWFPVTGFVCWDRVGFRWFACKSSKYNPLVVTRGALGNKSGSFCEAVNWERNEQEGKFLFAMLVSSYWFRMLGSGCGHHPILRTIMIS